MRLRKHCCRNDDQVMASLNEGGNEGNTWVFFLNDYFSDKVEIPKMQNEGKLNKVLPK